MQIIKMIIKDTRELEKGYHANKILKENKVPGSL